MPAHDAVPEPETAASSEAATSPDPHQQPVRERPTREQTTLPDGRRLTFYATATPPATVP